MGLLALVVSNVSNCNTSDLHLLTPGAFVRKYTSVLPLNTINNLSNNTFFHVPDFQFPNLFLFIQEFKQV
jgi:hypothetical protein